MKKLMNYLLALSTQSNILLQTDEPLSYEKLKISRRPTKRRNIVPTKSQLNVVKPNLTNVDPNIVLYISQLEKEISKLHTKNAKLTVSNISKSNEIKALTKEIVKLTKQTDNVTICLPYKIGGKLPTHVEMADGEFIEIFYKHDN